jgi:hypothetical protein
MQETSAHGLLRHPMNAMQLGRDCRYSQHNGCEPFQILTRFGANCDNRVLSGMVVLVARHVELTCEEFSDESPRRGTTT